MLSTLVNFQLWLLLDVSMEWSVCWLSFISYSIGINYQLKTSLVSRLIQHHEAYINNISSQFLHISGIILNAYSSIMTFTDLDFVSKFQKVPGKNTENESVQQHHLHESSFLKQLSYNLLIFTTNLGYWSFTLDNQILHLDNVFSLTLWTVMAIGDQAEVDLIDVYGYPHKIQSTNIYNIILTGWGFFAIGSFLNVLYYKVMSLQLSVAIVTETTSPWDGLSLAISSYL